MVYRLMRFNLGPGKLDTAKPILMDLVETIKAQPGYQEVVSFGDETSGNYGVAVLWDSAEASLAAKSVIGPKISKHLAANNASANPFSTELFEIIE